MKLAAILTQLSILRGQSRRAFPPKPLITLLMKLKISVTKLKAIGINAKINRIANALTAHFFNQGLVSINNMYPATIISPVELISPKKYTAAQKSHIEIPNLAFYLNTLHSAVMLRHILI